MDIEFRTFQPQDLIEITQMMIALYQEDPEGELITHEKIHRTIEELARQPEKGRIMVFTVDTAVVGYALLIFFWSNEFGGNILCIDELYVKAPWRNRGIATQFLNHLSTNEQFGRIKGLQLEVTPSNQWALHYYQRFGFRVSKNTHLFKKYK